MGEKIILIYSFIIQTETMEADGFQADTEDDDDEDCVLISTQSGELHGGNTNISLSWYIFVMKKKPSFWDKDSFSYFLCKLLCVNWNQGQADDFFKTWELSLDTTHVSFKSQQLKQGSISQDCLLTQNREMADHTVWHVKTCLQAFCLIHTATKK